MPADAQVVRRTALTPTAVERLRRLAEELRGASTQDQWRRILVSAKSTFKEKS